MASRRRRQNRLMRAHSRQPWDDNRPALEKLARAFKLLGEAAIASASSCIAASSRFSALSEAVERERTIRDALMYGMDRDDAEDICNEFQRNRQGRTWADLRDELMYMCIGGDL